MVMAAVAWHRQLESSLAELEGSFPLGETRHARKYAAVGLKRESNPLWQRQS